MFDLKRTKDTASNACDNTVKNAAIREACDEVEKLLERIAGHEGQVKAGALVIEQLRVKNRQLRDVVGNNSCPDRPGTITTRACVNSGKCNCDRRTLLSPQPTEKDHE